MVPSAFNTLCPVEFYIQWCVALHQTHWGWYLEKLDESTTRRHLKSPGHYLLEPDLGHQMVKIAFDLENSNDKVMAKVKPIGHIWVLEFNRYICFSFLGNRTTFGWDIANSIFDLENSRSRSCPRSNPMVTGLEINRYVCFSFCGNRTIFGWDTANSIFNLENSRSRSWPRSNPMVTFET